MKCVEVLLEVGVVVDVLDKNNNIVLYYVVGYGCVECVELFLKNGVVV